MKKTGEILKAAREEKGLSLNEVALSLKISSKVLKAIEEGDESQLPAKTFLRGFVKSYATFLRLDADKILESFYEEMGSTRPQPYIRPSSTPEKDAAIESKSETADNAEATVTPIRKSASASSSNDYSPLNKKNNTKTIVAVVLLCVLAGLIIFTKKMIDKYSKEAEIPPSVAQTMEGVTPVDGETPTLTEPLTSQSPTPATSPLENMTKADAGKTEPVSKATPTATPKASPSPSATETPKASPSPSATHSPSPTASASASASPTATASATASATPSPSASPTPEKPKPVELIVEALDTVEIEYSSPNGKPQKIKLSAEQVHTFKSKSGLKINFSNGGAVNLILNGKELGIPGDLGKPIKLSY
ncbi:helix-turn-helix domain-containing protein [Bdellovibrio sp. HCB185ZH]|uniref:helix-turn-helix domain-containing protein n=1 Tax=Bdellovibrio sp. HCB185ZH TaxID=3394235 RepID=UPI0039A4FCA1